MKVSWRLASIAVMWLLSGPLPYRKVFLTWPLKNICITNFFLGISTCYTRLCTTQYYMCTLCIPRFLLHSMARFLDRAWLGPVKGCCLMFSSVSSSFHWLWCSGGLLNAKTTFHDALPCPHLTLWSSKWTFLIYYWIQAHSSCQGTMVLIKPLWSSWPDACYEPTAWSVSSCTNWLHPAWHAKWIMSVRNIANMLYVSLSFLWYYLCWFFPVEASTGDSLDDSVDVAGQDQDDEDTSNNIVRGPDELIEVKLCSTIHKSPF